MTQVPPRRTPGALALTCALAWLAPALAGAQSAQGGAAHDPEQVKGPEACGECHEAEVAAWKQTHHAKTFLEMHRKDDAKAIVDKLGGKRIKVNEHCLSCHYTEGMQRGKPRAMWGITCESCHGQARDWIDVHNSYGPAGTTAETEDPAHRDKRIADAVARGMLRPENIYETAANCYSCHTIPDEELVNVGGHKVRSDFELVAWSQGEVRHNYRKSADKKNRPASPQRLRVLYVVGRALDLQYSLRSVAKASGPGPFLDAAKAAVAKAVSELEKIQAAQTLPDVAAMIAATGSVALDPARAPALSKAADAVAAATRKFAAANDGAALAAIDGLLPAPSAYHGEAVP